MDKKIAGLIGAVAGLAAASGGPAHAAANPAPEPGHVLEAASYAELLEPIPDAATHLAALDAAHVQDVNGFVYFNLGPPPPPPPPVVYWRNYGRPAYGPYGAFYYHHHHHHHHYHHHHHHH